MNPLREGLTAERVPEPQVMVIFGAGGDLSKRKLLPALYTLAHERLLPASFAVLGTARHDLDDKKFRKEMREACDRFARRRPVDAALWSGLGDNLFLNRGISGSPKPTRRWRNGWRRSNPSWACPPTTCSTFPCLLPCFR